MRLAPLIRRLKVLDKLSNEIIPFRFNVVQERFMDRFDDEFDSERPVRIIVLKARQMGISTVTQGIGFGCTTIFDDFKGLTIASENDNSQHLQSMSKRFYETYQFKQFFTPKYLSKTEIEWKENNSGLQTATARTATTGRGKTIRFVHGSEVAFWDNASILMAGLRQAIPTAPRTVIVLESTANGVGNYFHTTWQEAEEGSEYIPFFFPWFHQAEYDAAYLYDADAVVPSPFYYKDEEERILHKLGVRDSQLVWRRWAIRSLCGNNLNTFHQEYPSTPEEAFISTGMNVFPLPSVQKIYQPLDGQVGRLVRDTGTIRFVPDISGPLRIFRKPAPDRDWGMYFVGGDPTRTSRGDYACGQVVNRRNYEQVAVFRQRIDPMSFAEELVKLAKYYNDAMLTTEKEGAGYGTIGRMVEMNYPNLYRGRPADKDPGIVQDTYGFSSSFKSKEGYIAYLIKLIGDVDVKIHDRQTYHELINYVRMDNGEFGPADPKGHDDTVTSLGITLYCDMMEGPVPAYTRSQPRHQELNWQRWESEVGAE